MNIRQEVETAIASYAASKNMPIAYEGVTFTKPSGAPYLEIIFLASNVLNATVDAERQRVYGTFQCNVYVPDGKGMKALDALTSDIVALFSVYDKARYTTFSVEQPANVSPPMQDAAFRVAAVRVKYRQELQGS